jgi:iron complex outermembrane receptor protein
MNTYSRLSLILTISLLSPSILYAAKQNDPFFDMPIVLSASRLEQPASETPVAVTIIDRQTIEASGARTIPEVLRLVPGIIVGNSVNEFGDQPKIVVAYHGHTDQYSKQMQVLIDGRSIYEPAQGGVAWNMLPINLDDIERIEVSRGPNAASYGSNSFMAVVNIITRHAIEDQGQLVKVNVGNHNIIDSTYRFAGSKNDLDYRVTLSTQKDNGQDRADGQQNHDDLSADGINYRMDYQVNPRATLTYQGGYTNADIQADQNYSNLGIKPARETENVNAYQQLKYENNFSSKNTLVVQYYYNLLNTTDRSLSKVIDPASFGIPADPFQLNLNFDIKSQRHNLEATDYVQVNDSLRFIWGLSAQQDLARAPFFLGTNSTIRRETYRGFTNIEWHVRRNDILNFGVLIEKNNTSETANSPRLAYIHKFSPHHSLRFSISKAMRSPFIFEEFGNQSLSHELTSSGTPTGIVITDQQVGPAQKLYNEEIVSRDIGYYGRFFNNDLLFDARIYRDTLSHLISPIRMPATNDTLDGTTKILVNDGSTTVTGIEAETDYVIKPSLRIIASASFIDISSNDPINKGISDSLTHSAPHSATSVLAIDRFNELYSGSVGYYYVGRFSWIDASSANSNNYQTLDLKLSRKIPMHGSKASASIVLKNLLGKYSNYDKKPDNGPLIVQDLTAYLEFKIQIK